MNTVNYKVITNNIKNESNVYQTFSLSLLRKVLIFGMFYNQISEMQIKEEFEDEKKWAIPLICLILSRVYINMHINISESKKVSQWLNLLKNLGMTMLLHKKTQTNFCLNTTLVILDQMLTKKLFFK